MADAAVSIWWHSVAVLNARITQTRWGMTETVLECLNAPVHSSLRPHWGDFWVQGSGHNSAPTSNR
jgi:hypothetical protein